MSIIKQFGSRKDSNHSDIKKALIAQNCDVIDLSQMGSGIPDLLVQFPNNQLWLVEVKSPDRKVRLTQRQREIFEKFDRNILIIKTLSDIPIGLGI